MSGEENYGGLRKLADAGREAERRLGAHPYPRPTGPAPTLEQLRDRRDEIERIAARHGAHMVRVFGSVARGDVVPGSDVDILVEMNGRSLLEQAALQGELEDLLACPVHVLTVGGLRQAREKHAQADRTRSDPAVTDRTDIDRLERQFAYGIRPQPTLDTS